MMAIRLIGLFGRPQPLCGIYSTTTPSPTVFPCWELSESTTYKGAHGSAGIFAFFTPHFACVPLSSSLAQLHLGFLSRAFPHCMLVRTFSHNVQKQRTSLLFNISKHVDFFPVVWAKTTKIKYNRPWAVSSQQSTNQIKWIWKLFEHKII